MSRICEKCKRGYNPAVSRSHSNIATLRRQYVNLQYKTINGKRMRICSKCIKTLAKNLRKSK
ncbi:MAG: L28 family ribosomal protein [Patescibacteria group bacterium]